MTHDPKRDIEIILRYQHHDESERSIAKTLGISRVTIDKCLIRHGIAKRPRPPGWTEEDKLRLVILCNSLNNNGQHITGQEFGKFFPNRTYSSIKHHRDVLRNKKLIR